MEALREELSLREQQLTDLNAVWRRTVEEAEQTMLRRLRDGDALDSKYRTRPHLMNLHEDEQLSGCLIYPFSDGVTTIGSSDSSNIVLRGLQIRPQHCIVDSGTTTTIQPSQGDHAAAVFLNGTRLQQHQPTELHHNDRIVLGVTHYFLFLDPTSAEATAPADGSRSCRMTFAQARAEMAESVMQSLGVVHIADTNGTDAPAGSPRTEGDDTGEHVASVIAVSTTNLRPSATMDSELNHTNQRQREALSMKLAEAIPMVEECNAMVADLQLPYHMQVSLSNSPSSSSLSQGLAQVQVIMASTANPAHERDGQQQVFWSFEEYGFIITIIMS